ncbi:oligosaccharide flippase family protein [Tistlia consotensis]
MAAVDGPLITGSLPSRRQPRSPGESVRDIVVAFAVAGFMQLCGFATGVLAARLLLPAGRGELAAVLLWCGLIASISAISLDQALVYRMARQRGHERRLTVLALLISQPLALLAILAGWVLLPRLLSGVSGSTLDAAWVVLLFTPLGHIAMILQGAQQGRLRLIEWNLIRALQPAGYLLGIGVTVLLFGANVTGFVAAFLFGQVLVLIALLWRAPKSIGGGDAKPVASDLKPLLGYAVGVHSAGLVGTANQFLGRAVIALHLPAAELGLFAVAGAMNGAVGIIAQTLSRLAFPKIANADDDVQRSLIFARYFKLNVVISGGATALGVVLAPWFVPLVFGQAFAEAVPATQILLVAGLMAGTRQMATAGLRAHGDNVSTLGSESLNLALQVACLAVLLPLLGIVGAAVAVVAGEGAGLLYMMRTAWRRLGLSVSALSVPTADDFAVLARLLRDLLARRR